MTTETLRKQSEVEALEHAVLNSHPIYRDTLRTMLCRAERELRELHEANA